jgi:hypothetical protein
MNCWPNDQCKLAGYSEVFFDRAVCEGAAFESQVAPKAPAPMAAPSRAVTEPAAASVPEGPGHSARCRLNVSSEPCWQNLGCRR